MLQTKFSKASESLKNFGAKLRKFSQDYLIFAVLFLSLVSLAVGGYTLYLIKTGKVTGASNEIASNQPTVPTLTEADINQLVKNGAPSLGSPNAKITVVEYADFQCPYCEMFFKNVLPKIRQSYLDNGKVRFVFADFAFLGDESKTAAQAARCAEDQGKFWDYHDYLYNHQNGENKGAFSTSNLKKFAALLGLDTTQFNDCLENKKYETAVVQSAAFGRTRGVHGTPSTFINGSLTVGINDDNTIIEKIDQNLKDK